MYKKIAKALVAVKLLIIQAGTFPLLCNAHLIISRSKQSGEENSGIILLAPQTLVKKQWKYEWL